MRAEVQAFAKVVPSGKSFIFSLQMSTNIVSLFKHFGRLVFQNRTRQSSKTLAASAGQTTKMKIDFTNIDEHTISILEFTLKWRFTEEKYDVLPNIHLDQLKPLDNDASAFLSTYISEIGLHAAFPFKKDFFNTVDNINICEDNDAEVKKWLYQRGLPFDKKVYLSWDNKNAMIVPWKLLIKYFDSFYYGGSDDLTVFDESLQWSLMFFHEDQIYFGTNKNFVTSDSFETL